MASLPPTNFFFLAALVLVLPVTLALPAANGFAAYLGFNATPGSAPHSAALAVIGAIFAIILYPLPSGADQLCTLIVYSVVGALPGIVINHLLLPNTPWLTKAPPPPKEGASQTECLDDSSSTYGSDNEDPAQGRKDTSRADRQATEISRLHAALERAQRQKNDTQATDKAKFDKIIVKLEKEISEQKTKLETARQQPNSVTVTGKEGMGWLTSISDNAKEVALAALKYLNPPSNTMPQPAAPSGLETGPVFSIEGLYSPHAPNGNNPAARGQSPNRATNNRPSPANKTTTKAPEPPPPKGGSTREKRAAMKPVKQGYKGGSGGGNGDGGKGGGNGGGGVGSKVSSSGGGGGHDDDDITWTCQKCTVVNGHSTLICSTCSELVLDDINPRKPSPFFTIPKVHDLNDAQQRNLAILKNLPVNVDATSRASGRTNTLVLNPDGSKNLCLLHSITAALGKEPTSTNARILAQGLRNTASAVLKEFPSEADFQTGVVNKITNCKVSTECIRETLQSLDKVLAGKSDGLDGPGTLLLTCLLFSNIPIVLSCATAYGSGEVGNVFYFTSTTNAKPPTVPIAPPIIGSIFYSGAKFGHFFVYHMDGGCLPCSRTIHHSPNVTNRIISCINPSYAAKRVNSVNTELARSNLSKYYSPSDSSAEKEPPISINSSPAGNPHTEEGGPPAPPPPSPPPPAPNLAHALDGEGSNSPAAAEPGPEQRAPPAPPPPGVPGQPGLNLQSDNHGPAAAPARAPSSAPQPPPGPPPPRHLLPPRVGRGIPPLQFDPSNF